MKAILLFLLFNKNLSKNNKWNFNKGIEKLDFRSVGIFFEKNVKFSELDENTKDLESENTKLWSSYKNAEKSFKENGNIWDKDFARKIMKARHLEKQFQYSNKSIGSKITENQNLISDINELWKNGSENIRLIENKTGKIEIK